MCVRLTYFIPTLRSHASTSHTVWHMAHGNTAHLNNLQIVFHCSQQLRWLWCLPSGAPVKAAIVHTLQDHLHLLELRGACTNGATTRKANGILAEVYFLNSP